MNTPSVEAQVALFSPYCGGRSAENDLLRVLQLWPRGQLDGIRPLEAGNGHPFRLSWQVVQAPLETTACILAFPAEPELRYAFVLPAHQLVRWLMEGGDGPLGLELPDRFWQWLLLERGADAL